MRCTPGETGDRRGAAGGACSMAVDVAGAVWRRAHSADTDDQEKED